MAPSMRCGVAAWWAGPGRGVNGGTGVKGYDPVAERIAPDGVGHDGVGENGIPGVGGRGPVSSRATVGAAEAAPGAKVAGTLAGGGITAPPPPEVGRRRNGGGVESGG